MKFAWNFLVNSHPRLNMLGWEFNFYPNNVLICGRFFVFIHGFPIAKKLV